MIITRFTLLFIVWTLFFAGIIAIFSASSAEILDLELDHSLYSSVMKQAIYSLAALITGITVYRVGYKTILQISPFLLFIFTLLLLGTLIPGIGREVNGSRRWLPLGPFSFQPSEPVKYILLAFFIHEYGKIIEKKDLFINFLKIGGKCLVPICLILVEPNNGTVAVIGISLIVLCFIMKIPVAYWGAPLAICLVIGIAFASQLPYVSARIKVYLNPELDIRGKGHQPYQAKIAAGSGGLTGKGPGKSLQKLSYLPEAQNDYIAAIIAEEYGFIGIFTLIFLYALLALTGMSVAIGTPDPGGCYLAAGITFIITFQAFLNMGVVSGLLPSTGLNLPFVSQGGTSLIANTIGMALLLSIESCRVLIKTLPAFNKDGIELSSVNRL